MKLRLPIFVTVLLAPLSFLQAADAPVPSPNIVFILADDKYQKLPRKYDIFRESGKYFEYLPCVNVTGNCGEFGLTVGNELHVATLRSR